MGIVFLLGLPARPERHVLERHRRRLRGRDRRRPDHPRRRALRPLPGGQRARRHLRPAELPRLRRRSSSSAPWSGDVGRPARRPRWPRSPSTSRASACSTSPGAACAATGPALLLAYLWLACPFTLVVANSGANDALVGALVLGAFLVASRPFAARRAVGAAALTKFAPLALAPLFATYRGSSRRAVAGMAVAIAAGLLGLVARARRRPERLLGADARASRPTATRPFSLWGFTTSPALQRVVQLAAAAFAVAVAFVPRRRDDVGLAALAAAVLIAAPARRRRTGSTSTSSGSCRWCCVASVARASGRSTGSIESARPGAAAADQHGVEPGIVLGGVVADRHVRPQVLDRLLLDDADHAAARAGHADVGDVGRPARQHAGVVGGDVRVGADDRGDAAVEVPAHARPSRSSPRRACRPARGRRPRRPRSAASTSTNAGRAGGMKRLPLRLTTPSETPSRSIVHVAAARLGGQEVGGAHDAAGPRRGSGRRRGGGRCGCRA